MFLATVLAPWLKTGKGWKPSGRAVGLTSFVILLKFLIPKFGLPFPEAKLSISPESSLGCPSLPGGKRPTSSDLTL